MKQSMEKWLKRRQIAFNPNTANSICDRFGLDGEKADQCIGLCYQLESDKITQAEFTGGLALLTGNEPEEVMGVLKGMKAEAVPEVLAIVAEGWTLTDTGISHYNDIIRKPEYYAREKGESGRIISVSPDEALRMGAEAHGVPLAEELRIVDYTTVARIAEAMRAGGAIPLPVVDFVAKTQEGRHRILAAKKVGKTEIPLLVIEEPKPPVVEK